MGILLTDEEICNAANLLYWKEGHIWECCDCGAEDDWFRNIVRAQLKKVVELLGKEAFAEPQHIPQHGKTPVVICIDEDLWQSLLEEVKE